VVDYLDNDMYLPHLLLTFTTAPPSSPRPTTRQQARYDLQQNTLHTFSHAFSTYFLTSPQSPSGHSNAAKCPPCSCCSYVTRLQFFSSGALMPGNSSRGKKEKPVGFDRYVSFVESGPCSWRYG
jgi:hypothetical protein